MASNGEMLQPFFTYMGNKLDLADWIIPHFPPHKIYIEVFGGTFSIGLNKPKSHIEIYNDLNKSLSNLFHIVRTRYEEFCKQVDQFILAEEWYRMFHHNHDSEDELEDAVRYYFVMCLTFRGKYDGGFSYIKEKSYTEIFERKRGNLNDIHKRLKNVIITNKDCFTIVKQNNSEDTLLYLDPPYVNTEGYYKNLAGEFGVTEHIKLRDLLTKHKGYWFLSYEDDMLVCDLYREYIIHRKEITRGSSGVKKTEVLITNYKPQKTLFDL